MGKSLYQLLFLVYMLLSPTKTMLKRRAHALCGFRFAVGEGTAAFVPKKYKVIFYDRIFSGVWRILTGYGRRRRKKQVIIRIKIFDNNKKK